MHEFYEFLELVEEIYVTQFTASSDA